MRRTRTIGTAVLTLLLFAGCVSPNLTRRFESYSITPEEPAQRTGARIEMFVTTARKNGTSQTITNLSDRGQAQLIESLSKDAKGEQLLELLASPIESAPSVGGMTARNVFERRLVFSIEKQTLRPGDRISWARVQLDLCGVSGDYPRFVSWDKYATQYGEVDLGKMSMSQSNEMSLVAKLTPPQIKELAEATASASYKKSLTEDLALKQRYVTLTGALSEHAAVLLQEGVAGIDLTGNSTVDVTLKVAPAGPATVFSFSNLFDAEGKPIAPDKVKISSHGMWFADKKTAVKANLTFEYIIRHPDPRGARTVMEGDDRATYEYFCAPAKDWVLLSEDDLRAPVWILKLGDVGVAMETGTGSIGDLNFESVADARQFVKWLNAYPWANEQEIQVRGLHLGTPNGILKPADIKRLSVGTKDLNPV